jgi:hypothetical protein
MNKETIKGFRKDLEVLEMNVAKHYYELLESQNEFIIFDESDLEHDTPDDYLECRNDITGNVYDVHPLKVTEAGIFVVESDGNRIFLIRLSDLSTVVDRISICELMEIKLK